ncbi:MAG TPA: glutamate--tRNA ligase [Chloroflexia bacterium]|nr:glutamate--tRNA ligase [Chloroflexia bacterium]
MTTENSGASLQPARTRYAPSPTGNPHIGNIRTALFAYLWAKHTGGQFILRIEDTDRKRTVEGSLADIEDSLRWLGLTWDEGPGIGGPYGPYVQSERLELYQQTAEQLIETGHAYRCYCTPERLDAVNKAKMAQKQAPGYDRRCRTISEEEKEEALASGVKPTIRFKVPLEGTTTVHDAVVKPATVDNSTIQDAILIKSDGYPTYHLAHIVDDHYMKITHVIRSQEWLPSAPLHVMIYQALGWEMPVLVHPPVILNPPGQKGKLSKRDNAVSVGQYRELGYLPEALMNFLVLLGWSYNDKDEIFSKEDLIEKFDIARIQPTPAKFNLDKLDWMNAYYINHILSKEDFARRCLPFLAEAGVIPSEVAANPGDRLDFITETCALVKDKAKTLAEVPGTIDFMFVPAESLEYPASDLVGKNEGPAAATKVLEAAINYLKTAPEEIYQNRESLVEGLTNVGVEIGVDRGKMFWPPRVALSGRTKSPDLMGMIMVLGREESVNRLELARQKLAELA